MIKIKIGSFLEEHIEKIVLVISGLLCIGLLILFYLFNPNKVEYDGEKYSPSAIDKRVSEDAELLQQKLQEPAEEMGSAPQQRASEFLAMLDSAVSDVDVNLWPIRPYNIASTTDINRSYRLPYIGDVNDVAVEHIRAVAYCPTSRVTEQNLYYTAGHEPNDVDLVTVEAKFDVRGLYERFRDSFVENIEEQYADPCLAKPVFAAVQLQRRELIDDGTWSTWQVVPRSKIDHNRNLFDIPEDVKGLPPGGLKIQMLQLENKLVQIELLQPISYQFATASEEWFPPLLHSRYSDVQRKEALELRRIAREEEKLERDSDTDSDRRRNRRTNDRLGMGGVFGGGGGDLFGGGRGGGQTSVMGGDRSRRSRGGDTTMGGGRGGLMPGFGTDGRTRRSRNRNDNFADGGRGGLPTDGRRDSRRTRSVDGMDGYGGLTGEYGRGGQPGSPELMEIYDEYSEIMLTSETDFARMREDMVFWAHDDTVEPQKSYQYKIRLGVFNPVAGMNQVSERDASLSDKVILWSDFSKETETVEIPGTLYFFAREIQEAAKTVTISVCRYMLGHWHKEDFIVGQGEVIGDVVETEPEEPEETETIRTRTGRLTSNVTVRTGRTSDEATVPEMIDYGTGAVVVDTMAVSDWTGDKDMRTRHYYDLLYSYDGTTIEHTPVGTSYWDEDLRSEYSRISRLLREKPEPFKAWGGAGGRGRGGGMDDFGGRNMFMGGMRDGYGG